MVAMKAAAEPQFEEKPFLEYHIYDLQRKTTIKDTRPNDPSRGGKGCEDQKELLSAGSRPTSPGRLWRQARNEPVNVSSDFKNSHRE